MEFVDTHCHIQFADYPFEPGETIASAHEAGVSKLIAVGCGLHDSEAGVKLAHTQETIWASIGLHPHEADRYVHDHHALQQFHDLASRPKVVAIGETGLDYHYDHSSHENQQKLLRFQLDIAVEHKKPLIFHIREAFDDFWKIFDEYQSAGQPINGVVHSFSAGITEVESILKHNLYIGLNGIMTFTKDETQLAAVQAIPLEKIVLETDAPYLTPTPYRGTINEPKHVRTVAEFLSTLRNEPLKAFAAATTHNANTLFQLS